MDFFIRKNDLQPYYPVKVKKSDGTTPDLTGATINCTMKAVDAENLKIDRQTVGINITDGPGAEFEYCWQAGDTDTPGLYDIEFEITPASGGKFTVPTRKGTARVIIHDTADTV